MNFAMDKLKKPICGDVFCGVGGMSLGFEQAGFDIAFAIDSDPLHIDSYSQNFPGVTTICEPVENLSGQEIIKETRLENCRVDVLFGGSPCQGFSRIGRRDVNDPRNKVLLELARLISEIRPKYFVLENVDGILVGLARRVLAEFLGLIRSAGYSVVLPIKSLDASDFGVPQKRSRIFILGYDRKLQSPKHPRSTSDSLSADQKVSVWDAIGDLPRVDDFEMLLKEDLYQGDLGNPSKYASILRGEISDPSNNGNQRDELGDGVSGCLRTKHSEMIIDRFRGTSPGTYEPISRYYRLERNGLAPTLRSGSDKRHGSYTAPRPIHPVFPRCITVREAARLHSYPDWFRFHPTKWNGFRQIGNSVPPMLARAVAASILSALKS